MTASSFELWIAPLRPAGIAGETLVLSASPRVAAWVGRRYATQLLAAANEVLEAEPALSRIAFSGREQVAEPLEGRAAPACEPAPGHLFERFVIGRQNRLAHGAALAVAEMPGDSYNPLFIHGRPGLGKSHLLGAIASYLTRTRPELDVRLTTAERFTAEFVTALRSSGPEAFKRRYRSLDALLIDDVQFLEGKPGTEEEFVHTFNELYAAGAQIVLSSDRPPEAHEKLAQRLRDRFAWGLCVEIEPPDLETRLTVVRRLVEESRGQAVDPGVIRELAASAPANLRRLEGTVTRAIARSSLLGLPLACEPVASAEAGTAAAASADTAEPSLEAIQEAVCSVMHVSRAELLSKSRSRSVSRARRTAMYLARELTSMTLAEISRGFERDHSTVLHALRRMEAERGDPQGTPALERIKGLLVEKPAAALAPAHRKSSSPR